MFLDYRLLVRLATAENQALTLGAHGLLNVPGLTRLPYGGDYVSGIWPRATRSSRTARPRTR